MHLRVKGSWTEKFLWYFHIWELIVQWKLSVSFRIQNFVISLKTAYIEASLPQWQLVECATLLSNSVAKHRLHRMRSTPASTLVFNTAHRFAHVVGKWWETKQQNKDLVLFATSFFIQFEAEIFRKIEIKRWYCAVYIRSDSNVATHKCE